MLDMRKFTLCAFLIVFGFFQTAHAEEATSNWHNFQSPQGNFTASFPALPVTNSIQREDYTAYSVEAQHDYASFKIVYSIHKEPLSETDKADFLESAKTMYLNTQKAEDVKQSNITVGGFPGFEAIFKSQTGQHTHYRIFFAKDILYTMTVTSPEKINKKQAQTFFESLQIL